MPKDHNVQRHSFNHMFITEGVCSGVAAIAILTFVCVF